MNSETCILQLQIVNIAWCANNLEFPNDPGDVQSQY